MSRKDNIEVRGIAEEKKAMTNFEAMQKLSRNFAAYIESIGLTVPQVDVLLQALRGDDPAAKIVLVRTLLSPRVHEWESHLESQALSHGVELTKEQSAKITRFVKAMVEFAR